MAGAFQVRAGRLFQVFLVSMSERKSPAQLPEPRLVRTGRSTEAPIGNVRIDVCIVCRLKIFKSLPILAEEGKSLAAVTTPLATFSYGLRRFYSPPKNWWSIALNDPSTAQEAKQVGAAN